MDSSTIDFLQIQKNLKAIKQAKSDLEEYLNYKGVGVDTARQKLLDNNSDDMIVYSIERLDYLSMSHKIYSKLVLLFRNLDQNRLSEFRTYFLENYKISIPTKQPERPEDTSKESIKNYTNDIKKWTKEVNNINTWNRSRKFILDSLNDIITIELYGDILLDVTNLPSVYFRFFNTKKNDMEVFIQEIRNSPSESVQNIKRVVIKDVSGEVPNEVESAHDVLFYFNNNEDTCLFKESESVVYGVYEKYLLRSDLMKKLGGQWGLKSEVSSNIKSATPFNNANIANIPHIMSEETIEYDWFSDDVCVTLEECIYAEKVHEDGTTVFVITPSDFFKKYGIVLNNKSLHIEDITDNKNWYRKNDGSYAHKKGYEFGYIELDELIGDINPELHAFIQECETSELINLTEDEIYNKASDSTKTFKPIELEFYISKVGNELDINIHPKGLPSFDKHVALARDVYGEYMLYEDSEAQFSIWVDDRTLSSSNIDIEKAFNFLVSIGIEPYMNAKLNDFL